jgi:hypothetical protein
LVSIDLTPTQAQRRQEISLRFKAALYMLLMSINPYSTQKNCEPDSDSSVDCCICISAIGPFQALFIAPCSHCFHFKCIQHVLRETIMFPCPVCRQVANLEASVSMESIADDSGFGLNVSQIAKSKSVESIQNTLHRPMLEMEMIRQTLNDPSPLTANLQGVFNFGTLEKDDENQDRDSGASQYLVNNMDVDECDLD